MTSLVEVTEDQIKQLDDAQLTLVLKSLVDAELIAAGIGVASAQVPLTLDMSDDGEDGLVVWENGPERAGRIQQRRTFYQVKARELTPKQAGREIVNRTTGTLKDRVAANFDAGGTYVLFLGQSCSGKMKTARENDIRDSIRHSVGDDAARRVRVEICSGDVIAAWANEHYAVTLRIHALLGNTIPGNFMDWTTWAGSRDFARPFASTQTVDARIAELRRTLTVPRSVARIIGLSGLGKTRLALETFRPRLAAENVRSAADLTDSVVYVDGSQSTDLVAHIVGLRNRSRAGILVVDNCALELHQRLVDVVDRQGSRLSLLTIDYDLSKDDAADGLIELKKAPPDVIRRMIMNAYPEMPQQDIERVTAFADGFPRIAARLSGAGLAEELRLAPLTDITLQRRLLWGYDPVDPRKLAVAEACAIFHHLGFYPPVDYHRRYIAQYICDVAPDDFYSDARYFIEKGIIDRIGSFVRVSPLPLALRLAEDWFDKASPEKHERVLTAPEMPPDLADALAQQFSSLDRVERAAEIVRRLMSPNGPFARVETLNSKRGARMFRSFVNVDQEACLEALSRLLGTMSTDELRNIREGRRDIVWSLERLTFHAALFRRAARLLLGLAVAENESWSNNATGEFLQRFQSQLGGTELPAYERLCAIDDAIALNDPERTALVIQALGVALGTRYFTRTSGAEIQGSRRLHDWEPRSAEELHRYFNGCLDRLIPFAVEETRLGELARKQLAAGIRTQVFVGNVSGIDRALRAVRERYRALWPEAIDEIADTLRYEGRKVGEEDRKLIEQWERLFGPTTLEERLQTLVSVPAYGWMALDDDSGVPRKQAMQSLARDFLAAAHHWASLLPRLLEGEQRAGFDFGQLLAEEASDPGAVIELTIRAVSLVEQKQTDVRFLGGLLAAVKKRDILAYEAAMERCATVETIRPHLAWLVASAQPRESDLVRLLSPLDAGQLAPEAFRAFAYGSVLGELDPSVVVDVFRRVASRSVAGAWTALAVIGMQALRDDATWRACRELLRDIVIQTDFALVTAVLSMDRYAFQNVVQRLLVEEFGDDVVALGMVRHAIVLCNRREHNIDFETFDMLRPVIFQVLRNYMSVAWPPLRDSITEGDGLAQLRWNLLLTEKNPGQAKLSAFELLPIDEILTWARRSPDESLAIIGREAPPFHFEGRGVIQSPLIRRLIEDFGDHESLLNALTANLHSFSSSGSAENLYEQRRDFVAPFRDDYRDRVATWAARLYASFGQLADEERRRDEEWQQGIIGGRFPGA